MRKKEKWGVTEDEKYEREREVALWEKEDGISEDKEKGAPWGGGEGGGGGRCEATVIYMATHLSSPGSVLRSLPPSTVSGVPEAVFL
jgi:hypothetical protein